MSHADGFNGHAQDANTKEQLIEQNRGDAGIQSKTTAPEAEVEEQEHDQYVPEYNPPGMGQEGNINNPAPPQEYNSEPVDNRSLSERYNEIIEQSSESNSHNERDQQSLSQEYESLQNRALDDFNYASSYEVDQAEIEQSQGQDIGK